MSISILCVHGVNHGDLDPDLEGSWSKAICDGLVAWNPALQGAITCDFLKYDNLFEQAPLDSTSYAKAFAELLASGVIHGIGDLFSRERGLFEVPDKIRWTAGMVAQWVSDDDLKSKARAHILKQMSAKNYDLVCAHSLGSLLCYDTFLHNPAAIKNKTFVSFGSQIGNPCVRDTFAGRIAPLTDAAKWFHLYNPEDHVFTADLRLAADNFEEVGTRFDIPNDIINHDPAWYLGHAFAIVGYNSDGFIIQNSWDTTWGSAGRAVLGYEDWLDNAMDCWVAQLGVVTDLHREIAQATTLRQRDGKVQLASEPSLRKREISPFIIDMENNGHLSNTGEFRTQDSDIEALVNLHLGEARKAWGLNNNDPVDIAIYAHGGLTSESDAAATAAKWIPALYDHQIFPIFLMWETDLWATLSNRLEDVLKGQPRPTGGLFDNVRGWWNERLEKLLAKPGTMIWGEMKQNAEAITSAADSGGVKLFAACKKSPHFADQTKVRLHLIGHSAGSILHSHAIERLCGNGWIFDSVTFMAPAVRLDTFQTKVVPAIKKGKIKRYHQFHLSDDIEQKDPTCKGILGYSRSLLYLVSQSFEKGEVTPILGMEKYFNEKIVPLKLKGVRTWAAPGKESKSATHGGFDDDGATMKSVIGLIRGEVV